MTVRAWFTISAVLLVVLSLAVLYQFTRPIAPPEILVTSGAVRLDGRTAEACWPQRDGKLDCSTADATDERMTVKAKGTFRLVVAYPAQPEDGQIEIARGRRTLVSEDDWTRAVRYDLEPGDYTLSVQARYPADAFVHQVFPFRVTRSGN